MTQVTIAGVSFDIPAPYEAGHALNAEEASVLNQTFLENVRNNAASKIKAAKEKAGDAFSVDTPVEGRDDGKTLRQLIADYAGEYKFGMRVLKASEPVDPVEREARVIAKEALGAQLKAKGIKRKDVPDEAYEGAVATLAASDKIVKEAKRRVGAKSDIGLEELGIDLGTAAPAAA